MALYRLTDAQWEFIQQYLPQQHRGRPRSRDRECMEAVIYKLRTRCQWDLLPDGYPPKSTVWDRFVLWRKARVFDKLFRATRRKHLPEGMKLFHRDVTIKVASPTFPLEAVGKGDKIRAMSG